MRLSVFVGGYENNGKLTNTLTNSWKELCNMWTNGTTHVLMSMLYTDMEEIFVPFRQHDSSPD